MSAAGLRTRQRAAVRSAFPEIQFHGLHARYEEGFSAIDKTLPTLFVFLGSTIGNFNRSDFPRFFRALSAAMGPGDFLLLGADQVKDVKVLEDAYNDSRGVTAEFILNVFDHINRLLRGNFASDNMRYDSRYNPEWQRIEMYAVARGRQDIRFADIDAAFQWQKDEKILVEISRKFDPFRLQEQLRFFDLGAVQALHRSARMVFRPVVQKRKLGRPNPRHCRAVGQILRGRWGRAVGAAQRQSSRRNSGPPEPRTRAADGATESPGSRDGCREN